MIDHGDEAEGGRSRRLDRCVFLSSNRRIQSYLSRFRLSHGSFFLRLRKQRNVTCLCLPRSPPLVSLFSLLPIFRAAAVLRSSIDRSCGTGRRGECLRGSIERIALAYSHRVADRPSKFPSVPRSIVRTNVRSCGTPFLRISRGLPLRRNGSRDR